METKPSDCLFAAEGIIFPNETVIYWKSQATIAEPSQEALPRVCAREKFLSSEFLGEGGLGAINRTLTGHARNGEGSFTVGVNRKFSPRVSRLSIAKTPAILLISAFGKRHTILCKNDAAIRWTILPANDGVKIP